MWYQGNTENIGVLNDGVKLCVGGFYFPFFFSLPLNGWWVIFTVCFQELCFFLQYEQLMNQYTAYLHQLLIQYCSNSGGFDLRQEKLML